MSVGSLDRRRAGTGSSVLLHIAAIDGIYTAIRIDQRVLYDPSRAIGPERPDGNLQRRTHHDVMDTGDEQGFAGIKGARALYAAVRVPYYG